MTQLLKRGDLVHCKWREHNETGGYGICLETIAKTSVWRIMVYNYNKPTVQWVQYTSLTYIAEATIISAGLYLDDGVYQAYQEFKG